MPCPILCPRPADVLDYAWYDAVGNLGVACIVGSYLALQVDWLSSRDLAYSLLNAAGAVAVMISLVFDFNLSSMIIECFWLAISLMGIARWLAGSR